MLVRRIAYAILLLAASGFFIFNTRYLSWLLLCATVGFLPLQLLLCLPWWRRGTARLAVLPGMAVAGQPLQVSINLGGKAVFSGGRATLCCHNRFTGKTRKQRLHLPPGGRAVVLVQDSDCGVVHVFLRHVRLLDAAGILALPIIAPPPALCLLQAPEPLIPLELPPEALDQSALPQYGAAHTGPAAFREYSDIREYRLGDRLRDVHWKLTAKMDKMLVREGGASPFAAPQLCFDLYGSPAEAARVLGRVAALSAALCGMERSHALHWIDGEAVLQSRVLSQHAELDALMWQLLQTRLPQNGWPIRERLPVLPGPVLVVEADALELYEGGVWKAGFTGEVAQ